MSTSSCLVFALVVLAAFLSGAEANQKCYVCTSTTNGNNCGSSFAKVDGILEQDCANDCFKSYVKIGSVETYARGCSAGCTETSSGNAFMKCCNGKDFCNSATAASATFATILTAFFAKFVL